MLKDNLTIVHQERIADQIFELVIEGELVSNMTTPGQFVHVKIDRGIDPLLRRPISICNVDLNKKQLTMLYRAGGKGTSLLSQRVKGELVDVMGPLGTGFPVEEAKEGEVALLVGGGIGVPPLYYLSQQLKARGVKVVHVLGFASAKDVFYEEKFAQLGDTYVATVDGTHGSKGFVTDVIEQEGLNFDVLFSCGPNPMLKALEDRFHDRRAYLSLEERMGCGIGACLACVCHLQDDPTGTSYKKICTDGPVFPIGEVIL
ncbi:dihydroorotate dehydrogenase electron transfer subunit [Alkalihalobacterium chitinilyticum]|uniref:Dihydroorotate dehydrogenase B (NAD(+)), electron transfer subunit n=1 Tax=Alkalihalobacterium chitinilyticum TaxID=2980103 RepID=A0ABT5VC48_9BACI|nr:dihydroorotate dehydrogenase electron transfer subunit [Alkalihalobacterium chitinilyticum]MDE5413032.1 dihydroorotate dehydrogenase electron transfer subunit [Alkalihalobacterium chitinilyticum]